MQIYINLILNYEFMKVSSRSEELRCRIPMAHEQAAGMAVVGASNKKTKF